MLYGHICLDSCPSHYYDSSSVCTVCSPNCVTCDSSSCSQCEQSFYLYNGTCSATCQSSQFLDVTSSSCINCTNDCLTCRDPTTCLSCNTAQFYLTSNFKCLSACPDGEYQILNGCAPCNSNCLTCSSSSTNCLTCAVN